jgi:predicted ATPase
MAQFLNLHVGCYEEAQKHVILMDVIGQTTETGQQMVEKGEHVGSVVAAVDVIDTLDLFTNNDHFFNGVRLACVKGGIHPDNVTIYEYLEGQAEPKVAHISKKGRLDYWPTCFTAIEDALCQL